MNFEKVYTTLISILADQENVKIEAIVDKIKTKEKELVRPSNQN